MGTPDFAVPSLEALIHSSCQVVAVYTQPDRKSGRGQRMALCPVKRLAESEGLQVVQPDSLKVNTAIDQLAGFAPELIVVAAFGQILPQGILALPEFGSLNVHPSLLPRHRGSSPIASAILQGEEVTGVTIMLLDVGLDSGPILSQRRMPISDDDMALMENYCVNGEYAKHSVDTLLNNWHGELDKARRFTSNPAVQSQRFHPLGPPNGGI